MRIMMKKVGLGSIPPVPPISNKVLAHFDSDASWELESEGTIIPYGVTLDTTNQQFGTGAVKASGEPQYMELAFPYLDLGTDDFTLDFWIQVTGSWTGGTTTMVHAYDSAGGSSFRFAVHDANASTWTTVFQTGGSIPSGFPNPIRPFAKSSGRVHVAVVRSLGICKIYINGINNAGGDVGAVGSLPQFNRIRLFRDPDLVASANDQTRGTIDELRLRNEAVWTTNFTPPTEPYQGIL